MKKFLTKCLLYSIAVLVFHFIAGSYADGFTDGYYLRFTSPKQSNLIIGTSRAAQGIRPEYISQTFQTGNGNPMYNYAFTMLHSPYGQVYRESIEKKLNKDSENGVFIVTVDPWSISANARAPENQTLFKEAKAELGTTHFVNWNPNYEYLLDNYPDGWGRLMLRKWRPSPSVHQLYPDGWLKIDVPMDSKSRRSRTQAKIKEYEKNLTVFAPSEKRWKELKLTLDLLQIHGQVYLVRLPVSGAILDLENQYMPEFEEKVNTLSAERSLPYYDMTMLPDTFQYIDGNHLYFQSGVSVSRLIGEFLSSH